MVYEDSGTFSVDVNVADLNLTIPDGNFSLPVIFSTVDGTATCMSASLCLLSLYRRTLYTTIIGPHALHYCTPGCGSIFCLHEIIPGL